MTSCGKNPNGLCLLLLMLWLSSCESTQIITEDGICEENLDCLAGETCLDGICHPDEDQVPDGDRLDGDVSPDGDLAPDGDGELSLPDGDLEIPDLPADGDGPDPDLESDGDRDPESEVEVEVEPEPPANNSCHNPHSLPLGIPVAGSTRGADNSVDTTDTCLGDPAGGADVVYKLSLEAGAELRVTVAPTSRGFNPAIYLLKDCRPAPDGCLAGMDEGRVDEPDEFELLVAEAGIYYLVVDSVIPPGRPGSRGDFVVAAQLRHETEYCQPCGPGAGMECTPGAGCVVFPGLDEPVEYACMPRCEEDADCQKGYICSTAGIWNEDPDTVCLPAYGENGLHVATSCSSLQDIGTPCVWRILGDNDAACGADWPDHEVDDAVCIFFAELTDLVSYCTIYCVDDTECPDGYFCYKVPLTASDYVCKLM